MNESFAAVSVSNSFTVVDVLSNTLAWYPRQIPSYGIKTSKTPELKISGNGLHKPKDSEAGTLVVGEVDPMK